MWVVSAVSWSHTEPIVSKRKTSKPVRVGSQGCPCCSRVMPASCTASAGCGTRELQEAWPKLQRAVSQARFREGVTVMRGDQQQTEQLYYAIVPHTIVARADGKKGQ